MIYVLIESTPTGPQELKQFEAENIFGAVLEALKVVNEPPDRSMTHQIIGGRAIITMTKPTRNYSVQPKP